MIAAKAKRTTEAVLQHVVSGDIDGLFRLAPTSRISAEEVRSVIASYPHRPIFPSVPVEDLIDVVEVRGASPKSWSVNLPLWTKEEGRSDLVVQMHFIDSSTEIYSVELDDIHVL